MQASDTSSSTTAQKAPRKTCLIVIDGWGVTDKDIGNAILHAKTPVMDSFTNVKNKWGLLSASGLDVGLPDKLMGNSEVGHLNIGAGRVVWQDIGRIEKSIEDNTLATNKNLEEALTFAKNGPGRVHFLGMVSDGGVHSHMKHLFALLKIAKDRGVPHAFVQVFTDGRDTSPNSGAGYVQQLQDEIKALNYGTISTVQGRYYAMDRDKRWERILVAYRALVHAEGEQVTNETLIDGIKKRYEAKETDEFLKPFIVNKEGAIQPDDVLIFFNYRSDRMRQITATFAGEPGTIFPELGKPSSDVKSFDVDRETHLIKSLKIYTMTQYKEGSKFPLLFPPQSMKNTLAEHLSGLGLKQFHTAETEKYAHVTFFFNGGIEKQYPGEDRKLVPSPKVATYDKQPEMSVADVGQVLSDTILNDSDKVEESHSFVMCNFAPPDMVGHTGEYEPTIKACEATDKAIGQVLEACRKANRVFFLTADHGNAEQMLDLKGGKLTSHTTNWVPFVLMDPENKLEFKRQHGSLGDVAPSILDAMGLSIPAEMTGTSFFKQNDEQEKVFEANYKSQ